MIDLQAIRRRAVSRTPLATPANPANWLIREAGEARASAANPANRLIQATPISQLATLAGVASKNGRAQSLAEALAGAINRTCDVRDDSDANRAGLLAECAALPPEGQADLLAHFAIEAARWPGPPAAADVRVTCHACAHYRPGRCGNHRRAGLHAPDIGRDLATLLQRCPGFQAATVPTAPV